MQITKKLRIANARAVELQRLKCVNSPDNSEQMQRTGTALEQMLSRVQRVLHRYISLKVIFNYKTEFSSTDSVQARSANVNAAEACDTNALEYK